MNFDEMPWVVTAGEVTYGPLTKAQAIDLQDALRGVGASAVAWTAQSPDPRVIRPPHEAGVL